MRNALVGVVLGLVLGVSGTLAVERLTLEPAAEPGLINEQLAKCKTDLETCFVRVKACYETQ